MDDLTVPDRIALLCLAIGGEPLHPVRLRGALAAAIAWECFARGVIRFDPGGASLLARESGLGPAVDATLEWLGRDAQLGTPQTPEAALRSIGRPAPLERVMLDRLVAIGLFQTRPNRLFAFLRRPLLQRTASGDAAAAQARSDALRAFDPGGGHVAAGARVAAVFMDAFALLEAVRAGQPGPERSDADWDAALGPAVYREDRSMTSFIAALGGWAGLRLLAARLAG